MKISSLPKESLRGERETFKNDRWGTRKELCEAIFKTKLILLISISKINPRKILITVQLKVNYKNATVSLILLHINGSRSTIWTKWDLYQITCIVLFILKIKNKDFQCLYNYFYLYNLDKIRRLIRRLEIMLSLSLSVFPLPFTLVKHMQLFWFILWLFKPLCVSKFVKFMQNVLIASLS